MRFTVSSASYQLSFTTFIIGNVAVRIRKKSGISDCYRTHNEEHLNHYHCQYLSTQQLCLSSRRGFASLQSAYSSYSLLLLSGSWSYTRICLFCIIYEPIIIPVIFISRWNISCLKTVSRLECEVVVLIPSSSSVSLVPEFNSKIWKFVWAKWR